MTTDFRALCEELAEALDECQRPYGDQPESALVWKARAALAEQPLPLKERPDFMVGYHAGFADGKFAAVDSLTDQPVGATPVPVAERWPEFYDCDPHERVWVWNPFLDHWKLSRINRSVHTHWLPVNAIPVPEAQ